MENKDVNQESSPEVSEDLNTQTQTTEEVVAPPKVETPKGSQTPPENLYAALAEERRLRKEAEDKINSLTAPQTDEIYSDEGKMLKQQLDAITDRLELSDLQNKYPELKGLSSEFNEFRKEYPRHKGENVAKLFLAEKGLITPPRVGLEKPTGGLKVPVSPELTPDQIKDLREKDYRKYTDMVRKGLIKI